MKATIEFFLAVAVLLVVTTFPSVHAQPKGPLDEPIKRSVCIYDPVGRNGPVFSAAKEDIKPEALKWGLRLKLLPYTDEKVAMEDFEAGVCDAVSLTGVRNRQLVKFAGSLDMMGAVPTYDHMKKVIKTLARPKAQKYLRNEKYQTISVLPAGKVFLFVRPEAMSEVEGTPSVEDLAGQRVAALSYDQQALTMIRHVGASPVPADITNFAGMFNNGSVDVAYAPAFAYEAFELYRGLGEKGAVIDYVIAQLTYQITVRRSRIPEDINLGTRGMNLAVENFDQVLDQLARFKENIPDKYWVDIPEDDKVEYNGMFRKVRQRLVEQGVYDPHMVKLLRRVRCSFEPSRAECTI